MVYVPDDWIKNKSNEKEVYEILDFLSTDVVTDEIMQEKEHKLRRLSDLGESILVEKIKTGELQVGP